MPTKMKQLKGLKHCPFCGHLPEVYQWQVRIFSIECRCGIGSNNSTTPQGAKVMWNRRRMPIKTEHMSLKEIVKPLYETKSRKSKTV